MRNTVVGGLFREDRFGKTTVDQGRRARKNTVSFTHSEFRSSPPSTTCSFSSLVPGREPRTGQSELRRIHRDVGA